MRVFSVSTRYAELTAAVVAALLTSAGCGSSSNGLGYASGAQYFVVGTGQLSAPSGNNCPSPTPTTCTLPGSASGCTETTTESPRRYWALYPAANSEAFLQGALPGTGQLVGKQSGTAYSFDGQMKTETKIGSDTAGAQTNVTVSITLSGGTFSGSVSTETIASCSGPCTAFQAYDCTQTASVFGSEISVQEFNAEVTPGGPAPASTCPTPLCGGVCCSANMTCTAGTCM